jgi:hypothetical protein
MKNEVDEQFKTLYTRNFVMYTGHSGFIVRIVEYRSVGWAGLDMRLNWKLCKYEWITGGKIFWESAT